MPQLTLTRDSGLTDRRENYQVLINDKVVNTIADGQSLSLVLEPGEHTLQVALRNAKTKRIAFTVEQHDVAFSVRSNLRGWKILLAGIFTLLPSQCIVLEKA